MDFDYKKYSLEKLEEWINDAVSCSEATPQEIYDVIKKVVEENYYIYKDHASRCYELLALLNGNGKGHIEAYDKYVLDPRGNQVKVCDKDDPSPECKKSWDDFWEQHYYPEEYNQYTEEELNAMCDKAASDEEKDRCLEYNVREAEYYNKKDKVVKWQLPVEVDGPSGEYFVQFPDDLLEAANLKENDQIEWIDQGDGSYLMKKVSKTYDDMIREGWTMTADGFWIKE